MQRRNPVAMPDSTTAQITQVVTRILTFADPDRPIDEVMDDLAALYLYAYRNDAGPEVLERLADCLRLGNPIVTLLIDAGANAKSVDHNFKAMVYATLDHAFIDIALAKAHSDPFTLLTTAAGFILTRLAEYAYVESAKETQSAQLRQIARIVSNEMWESLHRNVQTVGLSWERSQQYKTLIRETRQGLEAAQSPEPAIRILTLLLYVRLLELVQLCNPEPAPAEAAL